jgi:hypothetical protein
LLPNVSGNEPRTIAFLSHPTIPALFSAVQTKSTYTIAA